MDNNSGLNKSSLSNSPSLLDEVMASYTPISKQQSKRQLPATPPTHQPNYGHLQSRESPSLHSYHNSPSDSQRSSYASSVPQMQNVPPHMQHRRSGPPIPNSAHVYSGDNVSQIQSAKQQPPALPPYRPPPTQHYKGPPPQQHLQDTGLPMPADYGLPAPRQGVFHPPSNTYAQSNMNMTTNPFEAVGLPSITAYNSVAQTGSTAMPALPARHRESIDSGNSHLSRSSSSMSIQGPSAYQQISTSNIQQYQRQPPHNLAHSHYQQRPIHSLHQQQMYARDSGLGLPNTNMHSNPPQSILPPPYHQQQFSPPPPLPTRNSVTSINSLAKHPSLSHHSSQSSIATRSSHGEPISRKGSSETENSKPMGKELYNPTQADTGQETVHQEHGFDFKPTENLQDLPIHSMINQNASIENSLECDSVLSAELQQQISVKERTKTFNRMASKVELDAGRGTCSGENLVAAMNGTAPDIPNSCSTSSVGTGISSSAFSANSSVKRRNSRAAGPMHSIPGDRQSRASSSIRGDDNETSSISTLDQTAKQWMVKASQGDYHALAKMLKDDPRLAKHKDFVSGYTALHWVR